MIENSAGIEGSCPESLDIRLHAIPDVQVQDDRWFILRTSGPKTLPLARSLTAAGFDAWTPQLVLKRRRPRSKAVLEIEAPILPTFVFARAHQLAALTAAMMRQPSPHPAFSVFRHAGRVPLLTEAQLGTLRAVEAHAARERAQEKDRERIAAERKARQKHLAELRANARVFEPGEKVTVAQAAFGGMTGVVEEGRGRVPVISFGGSLRFKVEVWLLDGVEGESAAALP